MLMIDDECESEPGPSRRLRRIAISIGCIVLGIICGLVVFGLTSFRRPPPPMSASDYEAAVARWESNRPANYEMELEVSGRQSGTMYVVVKGHEPASITRGGVPIPKHSWAYWTVDGLFKVIHTDLEGLDQPERAFGTPDVSQLVQQAEFDAELGYPRRYRRAVLSTGDSIEWEIVEFKPE
jgi:hypothetical protein